MISEITSTIIQILVLTFIPFLIYIIKNRSIRGFLGYIGLIKSTKRANYLAILLSLLLALPLLALSFFSPEYKEVIIDPETVAGKIRLMGFGAETIATIIIIAVFKTAFSEEIFFRGFIAKRLINVTNFQVGNILQAIIFGLLHAVIFVSITENFLLLALIFTFPAIFAYFIIYLNEIEAGGSIIPGWIAHGLANVISYSVVAFLI